MNETLLKKYVTHNSIKEFGKKEGIELENYEIEIIYDYIFNNYIDIYNSDNYDFTELKNKLKRETYEKIIEIYSKNKRVR